MSKAVPTPPSQGILSLPVVSPRIDAAASTWQGWMVASPLPDPWSLGSPLPTEPQGEYGAGAEAPLEVPLVADGECARPVELLAPAGGPEAAFAALHFGADAIYLGLKKFSARAEAENFSLEELNEITAYAHSLHPRRRVFVTVNTLVREDELPELVEDVAALADIGVDAVILQDLGVYHLIRRFFPDLEVHASTQLAVHNRAGAEALHQLGFERVVLARELTFEEVRDITAASQIKTEVFIHGALCYSYSGLCLFSSQTLGRSGNRGKCAYSCRDSFEVSGAPLTLRDGSAVRRDPRQGFPFSMKDLALPDHLPALRAAGVSCFKVEGRKKSPLYVATTTDYYRRLIDGRLPAGERPALEADMQTVFSRPWTRLFAQSHKDKEVADRDTVGHRGTLIGKVESVLGAGTREPRLRFRTRRALERHDGLQIDLPILGKPFGFAVERLWTMTPGRHGKRHETFTAAAGSLVEVSLPREHPELPVGAPVYCSSSQAVKQRYRFARPKPGLYRTRRKVAVEVTLTAESLTAVGRVLPRRPSESALEVRRTLTGVFEPARDATALAETVRTTFEKLGDTRLELQSFTFRNDGDRFAPVSRLNQLRRELTTDLEHLAEQDRRRTVQWVSSEVLGNEPQPDNSVALGTQYSVLSTQPSNLAPSSGRKAGAIQVPFQWSVKVDRVAHLDAFEDEDLDNLDELVVDIARDHPALLTERLEHWAGRVGKCRVRLALPALTRAWEEKGLRHKILQLRAAGWTKWEAANLSAWSYLGLDPHRADTGEIDLATDWSVYVLNRLAAAALQGMGVRRFALSPEDGLENMRSLLKRFHQWAIAIVYQDTPLFLAESCAYANLIGGCPGKANCRFESMEMASSHGEKVTALDYHCRTIVLNRGPFCLSSRLADLAAAGAVNLRADFIYRPYPPDEVVRRWRLLRAGRGIPGGHAANFDRGVQ